MRGRDRIKVFAVGFVVGSIIVAVIKGRRAPKEPAEPAPMTAEALQQEAVPGIYQAYQDRQVPMESSFVKLQQAFPTNAKGIYQRVLILAGDRPEQVLRIVETIQKGEAGTFDQVIDWRVMAANRLLVKLKKDADTKGFSTAIRPWGYRLLRKTAIPDQYVLSIPETRPESVVKAQERLLELDTFVVGAALDYLDEEMREMKIEDAL